MNLSNRIEKLEMQEQKQRELIEKPFIEIIRLAGVAREHDEAIRQFIDEAKVCQPGRAMYSFLVRLDTNGNLEIKEQTIASSNEPAT